MFIETRPHSELMICDKHREQRAFYFPLLLYSAFSQRSDLTMTERGSAYEEKYLTDDEISAELLVDTLSDVPDDTDSDSENDSDSLLYYWKQATQNCASFTELQ